MLNKIFLVTGLGFSIGLFGLASLVRHSDTVTMTVQCVDDIDHAVPGAQVQISFESSAGGYNTKRGVSDAEGFFSHRAEVFSRIYAKANKDGYYQYEENAKPYRMDGKLAVVE